MTAEPKTMGTAPAPASRPASAAPRPWQAPASWLIALVVAWFLAYTLPKYVPRIYDADVARVRILHGGTGILALVAALVQILPGLRRRYPRFHRWNGRVYVFGGVLPSSILLVAALFAIGAPTNTASFFWGIVWLATTAIAWRAVRRRRYAQHRRWMAYSVAITLVAATNGVIVVVSDELDPLISQAVLLDTLDWLPWVAHLLIAHWFVTRYSAVPYPARPRHKERAALKKGMDGAGT